MDNYSGVRKWIVALLVGVTGVWGAAERPVEESYSLDWDDLPDGFQHDGDEGVLAVGKDHACVLLNTDDEDAEWGRVHCWGLQYQGRLTPPENVRVFRSVERRRFLKSGCVFDNVDFYNMVFIFVAG